jgi:glucose-6-phosphate isomerase, archaeal
MSLSHPLALARRLAGHVDWSTGETTPSDSVIERRLSQMASYYADAAAAERLVAEGDPVVYRVYNVIPEDPERGLLYGITALYPGTVGDEFYMTKGHYHERDDSPELYVSLGGRGVLVLQTRDGRCETVSIDAGRVAYVPGAAAHRLVNTGEETLVIFGVWEGDAGHDYETIEREGFARRIRRGDA